MRRGLGQVATDQSGAVSTLQNQQKAAGGGATITTDGSPMSATAPATATTTTPATDTNTQLIAGQNATKVTTLSTASTNALLYGLGALAIGGVIAVAVYRSRRSRRRR